MGTNNRLMFNDISFGKPNPDCDNLACKGYVDVCEKRIYDLQQLLEVAQMLCSTLEFKRLIQSVLDSCTAQFLVLSAGVFLRDTIDSDSFNLGGNYTGFDIESGDKFKIHEDSPLIEFLEKNGGVYSPAELRGKLMAFLPERERADAENDISLLESLSTSLVVPLIQSGHLEGVLVFGEKIDIGTDGGESSGYYSEYDKEQILVMSSLAAIAINNAALVERSSTDMMTHLKFKFYFFNILSDKMNLAVRGGESKICVLMFDIDFFKKFNDNYGHACGDYVLQTVASIIRSNIRDTDMASRYGGEEFTVMLDRTGGEEAMNVAERIRKKIEEYDFCYDGMNVRVTISAGVAEFNPARDGGISPKMLVDSADKALYMSKRNGRNRVTFADSSVIDADSQPER